MGTKGDVFMTFTWVNYAEFLGLFIGAGGVGLAWGQFRLGIKETIDATGA